MKEILYVITKSNWGGAQRYVYDLATNLPKNAFEVSVALGGGGVLAEKLRSANIMIYHNPSLERDVSLIKDFRSFVQLYSLFRKIRPDVVHLNSSKAAGLGALAARLAGVKKIIFTVHGWPFLESRNFFSRAMIWLLSWVTAVLSHAVIVVSEHDRARAQKMLFVGKKTVRIYNGVDVHMQFGSGEKIRAAFPAGAHITGTIGELTRNKNQIALVEEARKKPDMYVALVGEGEDRAMLEQRIREYGLQERVKLFGYLPAADVLKGFDVFALPSLKEGLPYVLLEAKLAGLSIEANPVGGVPDILTNDIGEFSLEKMLGETVALY